jgi:hypothetical protein
MYARIRDDEEGTGARVNRRDDGAVYLAWCLIATIIAVAWLYAR